MNGFDIALIAATIVALVLILWGIWEAMHGPSNRPFDWERD